MLYKTGFIENNVPSSQNPNTASRKRAVKAVMMGYSEPPLVWAGGMHRHSGKLNHQYDYDKAIWFEQSIYNFQ